MQTRVHQIDTECIDCSPGPQAAKWIEIVSKLQQTQEQYYIVGYKTGPGSNLRYARLKTVSVVGVERRDTLIHCAEVQPN